MLISFAVTAKLICTFVFAYVNVGILVTWLTYFFRLQVPRHHEASISGGPYSRPDSNCDCQRAGRRQKDLKHSILPSL